MALRLTPYDISAFCIIVDNLDANGVSTTAITLISERGNMSRGVAAKAVANLLSSHLLTELDPRKKGHIMRYAVPAEMPWPGGDWR